MSLDAKATLRLTTKELEIIKRDAAKKRWTVSAYLRYLLFGKEKP